MLAFNEQLRDFVGADHTIAFFLDEDGFDYFSDDTDLEPLGPLHRMFDGYDEAGFARFTRTEDRASYYFELFHRMRRGSGSGAYHERQADVTEEMKRTDRWRSMFMSAGVRFMTGLSTPLPRGEATTCIAYERSGAKGYSEEGLRKLRLLVPAYETGVRAWRRMAGYRFMLDATRRALIVFGPEERTLFRSRGLARLLGDDPRSSEVISEMERLARRLRGWTPRRSRKSAVRDEPGEREITTGRGTYRLWASPVDPAVFGADAVLVGVERRDSMLPPAAEVEARFGLTPRQTEVALLLAQGLDNRAVAERLYISPHTARRHTESVLRTLGVSSRAAVAMRLLQKPS